MFISTKRTYAAGSPNEATLRLEGFELNVRADELCKSGRKIRLQALPLRILARLLETPGQVVR
jgi:DNA-binding response OmpR family regulator